MAEATPSKTDPGALLEFLFRLGQTLLACGEQTANVEALLRRAATAYGMRRPRVVALPTAIFISLHDGQQESVTFAEGPTEVLRLDQIADVYELANAAQRADLSPAAGRERLAEILRKPPRFGLAGTIAGHMVLTLGLAIVLLPTLPNLLVAAVLGTLVGALKVLNRDRPVLAVPLPVVAAALVSTLVFLAVKQGLPIDPLHALVPPLVEFLPGAMLTLGMVELAYGDMVSGSSRLTTGLVQLVLLVFGLAAGAGFIGYAPDHLVEATSEVAALPWSRWTPWLGVVVFGIGAFLHFSAPRNSLPWIMLVLVVTFAAQQAAIGWVGYPGSGFFGMLVATPLGYLIHQQFKGPPAMVTFLPSFWLLVPGAMSLVSVKRMFSDREAGVDGLLTATFVFVSIALGTLMGAALYKMLTERLGAWQVQWARMARALRRRDRR